MNPIYYVTFTTATLLASFVLFRGFNTTNAVNTISLLCGFLIIFTGVYLLNLSRADPSGHKLLRGDTAAPYDDGIPTDGLTGMQVRRSMQMRRSDTFAGRGSIGTRRSDAHRGLLSGEHEEANIGLRDLSEESGSEDGMGRVREHQRSGSRILPNR